MGSETRAVYPLKLNNGFSSEFPIDYPDRYRPEGDQMNTIIQI